MNLEEIKERLETYKESHKWCEDAGECDPYSGLELRELCEELVEYIEQSERDT